MAALYKERLAAQLRARRLELGMKQEDVARRMGGSVTNQMVSRWERGAHMPTDRHLEELARALDMTVADLMSEVEAEIREERDIQVKQRLDRLERKMDQLLDHDEQRDDGKRSQAVPLSQNDG